MAPILYNSDLSLPCRLVRMVAGVLGVELKIENKNGFAGELKTPEMLKKNPAHTMPALEDGDIVIAESRAIAMYLVSKYAKDDKLYPKDVKKRALVDQRLFFDQELYSRIMACVRPIFSGKEPEASVVDNANDGLESLDRMLEGKQWLAGDNITLADYSVINSLSALEYAPKPPIDPKKFANVGPWISRVEAAIPKYQEQKNVFHDALKKFRESRK